MNIIFRERLSAIHVHFIVKGKVNYVLQNYENKYFWVVDEGQKFGHEDFCNFFDESHKDYLKKLPTRNFTC